MTFEDLYIRFRNKLDKPKPPVLKPGDIILGDVSLGEHTLPVVFPNALRAQHLGIMGLSGSGKTYLIEHLIRQDIAGKRGFVVMDVHGDLSENLIAHLAEEAGADPEVHERTVILEPFDKERSFGFNPLEQGSGDSPFLQAQEFAQILRKRWQDGQFSPRLEELLRNSLYTLSVTGETLLLLPDLLGNKRVRHALVQKLPSGQIRDYWTGRYNRLSAQMQTVFREPLLTRISSFIGNPMIRDIVGQKKSTFSFEEAIRQGRWVIVNLSKGRMGEENSSVLGSMLFTKLQLEVMALASVPVEERQHFTIYADELQNLAGDTFATLTTEARKYRIGLVTGHQFWQQLDTSMRQAMLAMGSKVFFRLHSHDAAELAGELAVHQKSRYQRELTTLGRGNAIVRIGSEYPKQMRVTPHPAAEPEMEELLRLRQESAWRYTTERTAIHKDTYDVLGHDLGGRRGNRTAMSHELKNMETDTENKTALDGDPLGSDFGGERGNQRALSKEIKKIWREEQSNLKGRPDNKDNQSPSPNI